MDPVELALADAISKAAAAGSFDVIASLLAELEARRNLRSVTTNVAGALGSTPDLLARENAGHPSVVELLEIKCRGAVRTIATELLEDVNR
ncbi:MAG: hypothetical protein ABIQ16_14350, partial [Polyangiaceae bacterium]